MLEHSKKSILEPLNMLRKVVEDPFKSQIIEMIAFYTKAPTDNYDDIKDATNRELRDLRSFCDRNYYRNDSPYWSVRIDEFWDVVEDSDFEWYHENLTNKLLYDEIQRRQEIDLIAFISDETASAYISYLRHFKGSGSVLRTATLDILTTQIQKELAPIYLKNLLQYKDLQIELIKIVKRWKK
ncbi:MAG: hypothetical protein CMC55_05970 [Flavobacteriaceae bacterium]|nr:hypothetical protein [Flavobacteriaceae bacterium]